METPRSRFAIREPKTLKSIAYERTSSSLLLECPSFCGPTWCEPGAVVIDVGVNRISRSSIKERFPAGWGCGFRFDSANCLENNTQSRRGRAYDNCHADAEHSKSCRALRITKKTFLDATDPNLT